MAKNPFPPKAAVKGKPAGKPAAMPKGMPKTKGC